MGEFYAAPSRHDGRTAACVACIKILNGVTNAVHALCDQIAGGRKSFRALNPERKAVVITTARLLHSNSLAFAANEEKIESSTKTGFVYIVSNPSWPGFVKIGHALDPTSRLSSFNTGSPFRDYVIEHTRYFEDRMKAEAGMHALLADCREQGEWFRISVEEASLRLDFSDIGVTA